MEFQLIFQDKTLFRFPVNPKEVHIETRKQHHTMDVLKLGELSIPGSAKLVSFRFSSFLPRDYNPGYCLSPDLPDPIDVMGKLSLKRNLGEPMRLLVGGTVINHMVTIQDLKHGFKAGHVGDIPFEITFLQYRQPKTIRGVATSVEKNLPYTVPRPDPKPKPNVYKVKKNDTPYTIAKKIHGNSPEAYHTAKQVKLFPEDFKEGTVLELGGW